MTVVKEFVRLVLQSVLAIVLIVALFAPFGIGMAGVLWVESQTLTNGLVEAILVTFCTVLMFPVQLAWWLWLSKR